MVAPDVFKHQETKLERESRIFDEKEAAVNAEVLAAAQAHQAEERERLWRELLEFPRVDQYGVELKDPEEEEEGEEEVARAGAEEAEGSRKGKERARD